MRAFTPVLVVLVAAILPLFSISEGWGSLYSESDPGVVLLRQRNFDSLVLQSDSAWLVQFYNPHCGHCIHYAKTYKALAAEVRNWSPVMKVGVVDCVELGSRLCQRFNVRGTPTLRLIPPRSEPSETGMDKYHNTVEGWLTELVNFLMGVNPRPASWPDMKFSSVADARLELYRQAEQAAMNGSQYLGLLVSESADSTGGLALILDSLNAPSSLKVLVRRVPTGPDGQPVNSMQLHRFVLSPSPTFERVASGDQATLRSSLASLLRNKEVLTSHNNTTVAPSSAKRYQSHVDRADLEACLYVLLAQEVSTFDELDAPRVAVLRRFLSLLRSSLKRAVADYLLSFLSNLVNTLDRFRISDGLAAQSQIQVAINAQQRRCGSLKSRAGDDRTLENVTLELPLGRTEWLYLLLSAHGPNRTAFLPVPRSLDASMWTGCRGSQPALRGFSCALWQLMHTVTVQQAALARRKPATDEKKALVTLRDFILTFFTCKECASNFRRETASLNELASLPIGQGAVWLWKVHNSVNRRLAQSYSSDPAFPKRLFPTAAECARCHAPAFPNATELESGLSNDTIQWNLPAVARYLDQVYGATAVRKSANGLFNPGSIVRRHLCGEALLLDSGTPKRSLDAPASARRASRINTNPKKRNRRSTDDELALSYERDDPEHDTLSAVGKNDLLVAVLVYSIVFVLFVCVYLSFIVKRTQRAKLLRRILTCEWLSRTPRTF